MYLKALKPFYSPRFGNVSQGQSVDVPKGLADQFVSKGYFEGEKKEEPKKENTKKIKKKNA